MWEWLNVLRAGDTTMSPPLETIFLAMLLAFAVGQVIAWVYMTTHSTLSYSASFTSSLVVLPVIVAFMMILMSSNMVVAFGLLAVFAVVRFRNVLRDTRDTVFVMWAMVQGMAAGTFRFSLALIGALCVSFVLIYLWMTRFGHRRRYDAALSLLVKQNSVETRVRINEILHRHTDRSNLMGERIAADSKSMLSYRLLLRDPARHQELRNELASAGEIQDLTFYLQEDDGEV